MRTADKDESERSSGAGLLAIAWLVLFAATAGTVTWLYFYGEAAGPSVAGGIPGIVAPLPHAPEAPPQDATAPLPPAQPAPAVAEPTAEPPAPAPPPVAEAPPQEAAPPAQAPPAEAPKLEPPPAETKPPAAAMPVEPEPPPAKTAEKAAEKPPEQAAATPAPKAEPEQAAAAPPPKAEKAAKETPAAEPQGALPAETQTANLPPQSLPHGADPALIEHGRQGPLPIIAPDGRKPWQVYAKPFDEKDNRPRIAVVITDLGLSGAATETAIQQLPGSVTLGFSPYAKDLERWTNLARAAGHEVMLDLPMEPVDYPDQDPGPYTLLTSLDAKQNLFKMQWLLSRATGYVGVTNQMGSRFTTSGPDLKPVLEMIKERGLLFLDSRSSEQSIAAKMAKDSGMAWAYNNRFLDAVAAREAIDRELEETEKTAKKTGHAVAMGSAYPVTIERVAAWIPKAEAKGFAIAPVSAIANKQPLK